MKGKDKGELIIPIILIFLSIFLYINTYTFKFDTYQKANPQMWPRTILALIILVCLMQVGKIVFSKSGATDIRDKLKTKWSMMGGGILILFLYIYLMQYLGYLISTLLFTFCAMLMLGNRNKFQLLMVPLIVTGFIFVVFTHAMYIPLPKGIGIFRTFSLLFQ